ncbi:MAG: IclR family transcriptional regulator [Rhodospirillales bacterium]|nr:IclR family transcriptional regulator [Rhodospirillales bacterium]
MEAEVNSGRPAPAGAPALEKGLDLLEALAVEDGALTQKQLAARVGRSVSEVFRMLGVLERRGYIARDAKTGEYSLTLALFRLATHHPPMRRLQRVALPIMQALADTTGLGCHLSMLSSGQLLIVGVADPDRPMGWAVKLGGVFPFAPSYVSARVLAAFQRDRRREEMVRLLAAEAAQEEAALTQRLDRIAAAGYDLVASELIDGFIDISCPILDEHGQAAAALTLPFLPRFAKRQDASECLALLKRAARDISAQVGGTTTPEPHANTDPGETGERR